MARKRRRGAAEGSVPEASRREADDATLARAAAAEQAPQEEAEEEALLEEEPEVQPEPPVKRKKRSAAPAGEASELGGRDAARQKAESRIAAWVDNSAKLDRWLESRGGGLEPGLAEQKGAIVRLRDFFPLEIADSALSVLEGLPEEAWELSEQGGEDDAARHRFWSADLTDIPALAPLRGVFWRMLKAFGGEPTLPIFSVGRYGASDFIGRHDDRVYSRTVAAIWYLTREWSAEEGGSLLDLEATKDSPEASLVPAYNSMVVFEVPHMHAVSAVSASRYRYSIFGWWHQKGKRYELPASMTAAGEGEASAKRSKKKKSTASGEKAEAAVAAPTASGGVAEPSRKVVKKKKRKQSSAAAGGGAAGEAAGE